MLERALAVCAADPTAEEYLDVLELHDELAEAYDGWSGPLKIQVTGPWTLGATIELPRGERAVADHGARHTALDAPA